MRTAGVEMSETAAKVSNVIIMAVNAVKGWTEEDTELLAYDIFVFSIFPGRKMVNTVRKTNEETRITPYKNRKYFFINKANDLTAYGMDVSHCVFPELARGLDGRGPSNG
ncbi:hypothetical protein Bca52824_090025 [Brassica carinata]|uniref:Uncharacterized protein n=1 Tax=Brassica carinata TaxID=52824 RepID=A0A8X7NUH0_BRACI|nr:hypothetical protein Bca52824_090025 [Brassica carinata]